MKNDRLSRVLSIGFAVFIAVSGIVSLIIDEIFKPFLDAMPEVKLVIILISVLSAYHVFLSFTINNIVKEEHERIKKADCFSLVHIFCSV